MKILNQHVIEDKCLLTKFDNGHIQIDYRPISESIRTIDLSPGDVEILKKFLDDTVLFGFKDGEAKPLYIH